MENVIETKTVVVAKVPSGATAVLFAAIVEGDPTEAQIETARYSVEANLENVGATATSAYLTRFPAVALANDETLRLDVAASLSKIAPDPLSGADETAAESEASEA